MCAAYATVPASETPSPDEYTACSTNQKPSTSQARQPQRQEDQERYEDPDPGLREQHQIGAQDTGDRPGGADQGVARVGVEKREAVRRRVAADDVEERVAHVAEAVLDVVAEDQQKQHVAQQVQPAAVQEQRREHGQGGRLVVGGRAEHAARSAGAEPDVARGHQSGHLVVDQFLGHGGVLVQVGLEVAQLCQAALARHRARGAGHGEEHEDVGGDQRVRDPRGAACGVHVMDGDDHKEVVPPMRPVNR